MGYGWPDLGDPVLSQCELEALAFIFAWALEGAEPYPRRGPLRLLTTGRYCREARRARLRPAGRTAGPVVDPELPRCSPPCEQGAESGRGARAADWGGTRRRG
jgi:hypothetical protein